MWRFLSYRCSKTGFWWAQFPKLFNVIKSVKIEGKNILRTVFRIFIFRSRRMTSFGSSTRQILPGGYGWMFITAVENVWAVVHMVHPLLAFGWECMCCIPDFSTPDPVAAVHARLTSLLHQALCVSVVRLLLEGTVEP